MLLKDRPIRRKLMAMILLTSGVVLLLTCTAFFAYEFLTFRQATVRQLSTLGEIIAANSTAALAFDNPDDAQEILAALQIDRPKHISNSLPNIKFLGLQALEEIRAALALRTHPPQRQG